MKQYENVDEVAQDIIGLERENLTLKVYLAISILTTLVALAARFAW